MSVAESIAPEIPDADAVRLRLAVLLTETGVLRAQLRVSQRCERERERLQRQGLLTEKRSDRHAERSS
jgi:hypothetical protein